MAQKNYDVTGNEVTVSGRTAKKRGGCLKGTLIAIGAFVVLGTIGEVFSGDDTTTETAEEETTETVTSNEEATDTNEEATYSLGESVDVGGLSVTVNGKSNQTAVGNGYLSETAGSGNYLLLDITITNNGNESVTVDDSNFKLIRGETTYKSDGIATGRVNEDSNSFFLNQLNPESTLSGTVAFDISEESASDPSLQLEVSSGFFSGDTELIGIN